MRRRYVSSPHLLPGKSAIPIDVCHLPQVSQLSLPETVPDSLLEDRPRLRFRQKPITIFVQLHEGLAAPCAGNGLQDRVREEVEVEDEVPTWSVPAHAF